MLYISPEKTRSLIAEVEERRGRQLAAADERSKLDGEAQSNALSKLRETGLFSTTDAIFLQQKAAPTEILRSDASGFLDNLEAIASGAVIVIPGKAD